MFSSKSGVVNVYDSQSHATTGFQEKLLKAFGNLTTSVSTIRFNHNSEVLAMASDVKKDQFRLVSIFTLPNYSASTSFRYTSLQCLSFQTGLHQVLPLAKSLRWTFRKVANISLSEILAVVCYFIIYDTTLRLSSQTPLIRPHW